MNPTDKTRVFVSAIMEEIENGNLIAGDGGVYEFTDGVLCVEKLGKGANLGDVARNVVTKTKGNIICTSSGLSFLYGKQGCQGRLLFKKGIKAVRESREAYERFTGVLPKVYSVSSVARLFLKGLTPVAWHGSDERLIPPGTWHYQHCIPGEYKNLSMIDCKSYYFQLLKRVTTLEYRCFSPGRLTKVLTNDRDMVYFRDMLECIEGTKLLRNTIVGCMAGGGENLHGYCVRGGEVKRYSITPQFGAFRGVGLLIVATGAELTKNACLQTNAIYGNIDCVAGENPLKVGTIESWARYGIITELKATGNGEFCHIGSWKLGEDRTIPYSAGNRVYLTYDGKPTQTASWAKQWL